MRESSSAYPGLPAWQATADNLRRQLLILSHLRRWRANRSLGVGWCAR